jgi:hypothetical protein
MILEGIVTTLSPAGEVNIAPMGPEVGANLDRFVLKPFRSAKTYANLKAHPEGVFHVTDDVLLLASAAIGPVEPLPEVIRASTINGFILAGACRAYEFRVANIDDREERTRIDVTTVHATRLRDFFGFNRAKHAVVEAAILATRTAFLPAGQIRDEFRRLEVIVQKTGGDQEREAFQLLQRFVNEASGERA